MKPRTKFQKEIVALDEKLPQITQTQMKWARENAHSFVALRNKSGNIHCLHCGHVWKVNTTQGWQDEVMGSKCPNCKHILKVHSTQQRTYKENKEFRIISTFKGYQVIRTFEIRCTYKAKQEAVYWIHENSRIYLNEKGKYAIIGYGRMVGWYGIKSFGEFSLKNNNSIYAHNQHVRYTYPRIKVLDIIKRNGLVEYDDTITPFDTFWLLLTQPVAETLLKTGYVNVFHDCCYPTRLEQVKKYWSAFKIVFRNKYRIKKTGDYLDYLKLLESFGKDLSSSKYVCPKNFREAHSIYVKKEKKRLDAIRRKQDEERKQKEIEKLRKDKEWYIERMERWKDVEFKEGDVRITIIKTVDEVEHLGKLFGHCIHTNGYHREESSLLLCGHYKEKPKETIELSLKDFRILQSRGRGNRASRYNKPIISTLEKNIKVIRKIAKQKNVKLKSA